MAATIDNRVAELERANAQLRRQLDACSAELKEARDQQTATAEVLQVINSSPGDLTPVFDAILDKGLHLCEAAFGTLWTFDSECFHAVALRRVPAGFAEVLTRAPYRPEAGSAHERLLRGAPYAQIDDAAAEASIGPVRRALVEHGGARTVIAVPLLKDGTVLGAISAFRQEVRSFSDKQIALLQNFAAQAVIAMENARLLTETREALEQQTATAEVLQVINSSPGDLAPVFDAVIENSMRLCEATQGHLYIYADGQIHAEALRGEIQFIEWQRRRGSHPVTSGSPTERALRGEQVIHIADATQIETYRSSPAFKELIDRSGIHTGVTVALRRDEAFLGTINVYRQEVRPFTDRQIALLQNFAAQAVIAMENARLLTETREALEQQTATAEVLQVINSSPGDLAPVFDTMLGKARRLCEAELGLLLIYEGDCFHAVSLHGAPEAYVEFMTREPIRPGPHTGLERLVQQQRIVHIADLSAEQVYRERDPLRVASVELAGMRTFLAVPLVKEEALLGAFVLYRQEVRPFSEKQTALLQNFAAQAVIAMENARLLTETREALEQQTATAEVLQVINSSPGDLTPVFDAMLEKALRLCEASFGVLCTYDETAFRAAALRGVPAAYAEFLTVGPLRPGPGNGLTRVAAGEKVVHVVDLAADDVYRSGETLRRALVDLGGARSALTVALLKDELLLGAFIIYRREVRAFTDKQIALVQNFAAQAVIAMENARLITETREALEQQTATAEVLQVINSSPGDLAPVFDAMLEKAMRLCEAAGGALRAYDGAAFRAVAMRGVPAAFAEATREQVRPDPQSGLGRIEHRERVVQIADLADPEDRRAGTRSRRDMVELGGIRTSLWVALRKEETLLGTFVLYRKEVRPFTDKQIALVENFAAQAVIAMENARLLTETREALEQQTATAEVLQVINSSPGDLAPVFDAMLERAVRLCEFDFSSLWTFDGTVFRPVARHGVPERFWQYLQAHTPPPFARVVAGERLVHIPDVQSIPALMQTDFGRGLLELGIEPPRSLLIVSLRKDDALLGVIVAYRHEVRPFSDKQIALLQNFAAQAVIAMENARLLTETREALEQQTATAEVLQVINSSPGDLAPVFDAMLDRAIRLCEAAHGHFLTYDGETFHPAAVRGEAHFAEYWRQQGAFRPSEGNPLFRLVHGERIVHLADAREDSVYRDVPVYRRIIDIGEIRTSLTVPLRKDGALLGAFVAYRQEVRPFSDKQIALLQNFAAQAVIAMENARLLTETREALEQQTATAEVLQVINSSPGDLAPVFDAILEKATHLCDVPYGSLELYDGERFRAVAVHGLSKAFADKLQQGYPASDNPATRPLIEGSLYAHITDLAETDYSITQSAVELAGARTLLCVPLRRDNALLGMIACARQELRPFSEKEIALLQNFAAQAVIAMENARLLTETREALEQQTATAEVLQVINSSPGDLAPVFDAMLEKAMRLCRIALGALELHENGKFRAVAVRGVSGPLAELLRQPFEPPPESPLARLIAGEKVVQITDMSELARLRPDDPRAQAGAQYGLHTALFVPLRKDADLLGQIVAFRQELRPFSEKEIALLQNFAAQAVIAMENARLITETREALERQAATAEVLGIIASSPSRLEPVFEAMLANAVRICAGTFGTLALYDGEGYRGVAAHGVPSSFPDTLSRFHRPVPGTTLDGLEKTLRTVQLADCAAEPAYDPVRAANPAYARVRSHLCTPMIKDNRLLGAILIYRDRVLPFDDKQIELVESFAKQAVIAIENARLINETREALEQQTATAEVLQVINSSPGDLAPVFDAILEKAHSLCGVVTGSLQLLDGEYVRAVAVRGAAESLARRLRAGYRATDNPITRPLLDGARFVHIPDLTEIGDPRLIVSTEAIVTRTLLCVALRQGDALLGMITAGRLEVKPFSEKEVALLENFAAQAVIAMENARLLNELRQRTSDLQESLEYQTATSDVLRVISGSVFDLEPVLQTVLSRATDLCRSPVAEIFRLHNGGYRWAAGLGVEPEYEEIERRSVIKPGPDTLVGRVALERRMVHVADVLEDPLYGPKQEARLGKFRTMLGVPLLRDDMVIGVIAIARWIVEPYTDKEIRLVTTFADQAVIAIENARLLGELRERTAELGRSVEELKMLGEVGRAVSSTLDLRAVLSTILTASLGMTWANAGAIFRYIRAERAFRLVEAVGWDEALLGSVGDLSIAETETLMSEAALSRTPIQLTDLAELPSTRLRDASLAAGLHSVLIVPLVGPERIFGALVLQRREAGEFPAETVRLMQTLASQSVLAIQNARLFREIADKSEQLALASEHKSQFLANMSHELRTPLNAILGYAELLVDGIYGVLPEKAQGVLERVQNNGKHLLALINDVLDLAKIEAGQLALTLEDYALAEVVRSVVTATEPLAAAKGLKFTAIVQEDMPMAHGDARRVSQVLLNLAGNAIKFTDAGEVEINASAVNGQFVLTVRDTGPGIADADQERIFGEFQQIDNSDTRKRGGTGLGLAISKRMVEMQGGMISVDSALGAGSTFRVVLPVHVEPALEEAA